MSKSGKLSIFSVMMFSQRNIQVKAEGAYITIYSILLMTIAIFGRDAVGFCRILS